MKKIYLDTDIFVDILLNRDIEDIYLEKIIPFLKESSVYMSSLSVHSAYKKLKIKPKTEQHTRITDFVDTINLVPVTSILVGISMAKMTEDFETTLHYYSALEQKCEYILTRDCKKYSTIVERIPTNIYIVDTLKDIS